MGCGARPHAPAVAVIYEDSFNYLTKMCLLRMREAALRMIDLARARGYPVVVSGSDATDHPEAYLRAGRDSPSSSARRRSRSASSSTDVDQRRALDDVAGIAYRDRRRATLPHRRSAASSRRSTTCRSPPGTSWTSRATDRSGAVVTATTR